jgi:flagellar protein FlaG
MNVGPVQLPNLGPAGPSASRQADPHALQQALATVNSSRVLGDTNEVTFSVDPDTNKLLVRLVDKNTREVISQIPAEYLLRLARQLRTI